MKKLFSVLALLLLLTSGAYAANENLFNAAQPTGYTPNPSTIRTVTTAYTAVAADHMIQVDASAGAVTVTLPPITTTSGLSGRGYIIKKIDTSTNAVTVTASTTDNVTNYIGKAASRKLALLQNAVLSISLSTGQNWGVDWETPPIQADMSTGSVNIYTSDSVITPFGPLGGNDLVSAQTASVTLTAADCGKLITMGTGTTTATLPAATSTLAGCTYTIMNIVGAPGPVTIGVNSADNVYGGCTLAGSVVTIDDTAGDDIINTGSTSVKGDYIRITSDGSVGYYITGCQGIWAEL